jgi:hypothetical protein
LSATEKYTLNTQKSGIAGRRTVPQIYRETHLGDPSLSENPVHQLREASSSDQR